MGDALRVPELVAPAPGAKDQMLAWLREQPAFKPMGRGEQRASVRTGFAALDDVLAGGWPCGTICELVGSSGRTSLALGSLGAATRHNEVVAWIDAADALDPLSVRAAGVSLPRFLWVRPQERKRAQQALKAADLVLDAGGFAFVVLDLTGVRLGSTAAPWVRLARRVEATQTALICLGEVGSFCSALRLRCHRLRGAGFEILVEVVRQRFGVPGGRVTLPLARPVD